MRRRGMLRMVALILSLVFVFTACTLGGSSSNTSTTAQGKEQVTVAGISKKTIHENGDKIIIEASYPETKAANVNTIIVSEIRKNIDNFKKNAGTEGGSLKINYEIYPGEGQTFSTCYTLQTKIGKKNTESSFARTYDISDDGVYSIKDFFPSGDTSYLQTLSDTVRANAKNSGIVTETAQFENGTKADAGLYSSFILENEKFVFVFPSGQIADHPVKVEVPVSVFGDSFQKGKASIKEFKELEESENIPVDGGHTTTTTQESTTGSQTGETTTGTNNETTTTPPKKPDDGTKKIALTFDDGPGPYTDQILAALKKYNGKATFFMVGNSIKAYPEQVKHVYEAGCQIGNHTLSHKTLTKLNADGVRAQVNEVQDMVEKLTGHRPTLMRPPGGAVNKTVRQIVDMPFILWNVDTLDWKKRDADYVYNYVVKTVSKGDIILMHDIHKTSAEAAVRLIKSLTEQGYELVTISELFDAYGPQLKNGVSYSFVSGSSWK